MSNNSSENNYSLDEKNSNNFSLENSPEENNFGSQEKISEINYNSSYKDNKVNNYKFKKKKKKAFCNENISEIIDSFLTKLFNNDSILIIDKNNLDDLFLIFKEITLSEENGCSASIVINIDKFEIKYNKINSYNDNNTNEFSNNEQMNDLNDSEENEEDIEMKKSKTESDIKKKKN